MALLRCSSIAASVTLPLIGALALAGPASAATTIGAPTDGAALGSAGCGSACTVAQTDLPGRTVAAPADGVIVRWRVRGQGGLRLRTVRRTGAETFSAPGPASAVEQVGGSGGGATRLPVRQGDLIGVELSEGASLDFREVAGARDAVWSPPLGPESRGPDEIGDEENLLSADVEPDGDGDGYGDESQDGCPRDPALYTRRCIGDVSLSVAPSPVSVPLGDEVRLGITARNLGPGTARGVRLSTDGYAPGKNAPDRFRSGSLSTSAGTCSPLPGVLGFDCALGDLRPGQVVELTMPFTPLAAGTYSLAALVAVAEGEGVTTYISNNRGSVTFRGVPRPGRCANLRRGTPAADVVLGSTGGDRIVGAAGADLFKGLGGDDCLSGDAGADRLFGGDGSDRVLGGSGNDRLVGGAGTDRLDGGPGRDELDARDGRAERVSCGAGRDRVRADRRDRLIGCEQRLR